MLWKQISSAKLQVGRHPKMHRRLALRSQNALPRAAHPSWPCIYIYTCHDIYTWYRMTQKSYMHTYILYIHSYVDMMCIYIYIAESTIYIQVVMFIHDIDMYIYIYICTYVCIDAHVYKCVCILYIYIYVYSIYNCIYIYTHTYVHDTYMICVVFTHTYIPISFIYIHILSMHPIT